MKQWAAGKAGTELPEPPDMRPGHQDGFPEIPPGMESITVDDLLNMDIPLEMRDWLLAYREGGPEWAEANNPPGFVDDEACWEKAKRAADHAGSGDFYAFVNWWYHNYC